MAEPAVRRRAGRRSRRPPSPDSCEETSGWRASSSRTAGAIAPVPRPWITRTSSRPASAAVSTNARSASRASCARPAPQVELRRRVGRRRRADRHGRLLRRRPPGRRGRAGAGRAARARGGRHGRRRPPRPSRSRRSSRARRAPARRPGRRARAARSSGEAARRLAQRPTGPGGALGRGAETPVALALLGERPRRRRAAALALERGARRGSRRAARRARPRVPASSLSASPSARSRSARADARTRSISCLELGHARLCGVARASRPRRARAPRSPAPRRRAPRPPRPRRAARSTRRRSGATCARAASHELGGEAEPLGDAERVRRAGSPERDPVERRLASPGRTRSAAFVDALRRARPLLELGVVARRDGQPCLPGEPPEERPRERRALDRVGPRRDLVEQDERAVGRPPRGSRRGSGRGRRTSRGSSRSTARRRCRRAPGRRRAARRASAGGRSPHWCSSAASPSVFSATVLPPVFGPLITTARRSPSSRSIGTAVAGSSSGCRAPRRTTPVARRHRRAPPAPRERRRRRARGRSRRRASTSAVELVARARRPRARARAGSARPPRARRSPPRGGGSSRSTTANGSTNSVCPEPGAVVDDARAPRRARTPGARARAGRARSVTKSSCRCSRSAGSRASDAQTLGDPRRALRGARAGGGGAPATRRRGDRSRRPRPPSRSCSETRDSAGLDAAREPCEPGRVVRRLERRRVPRPPCRSSTAIVRSAAGVEHAARARRPPLPAGRRGRRPARARRTARGAPTASVVSACRAATSSGSADGASARACDPSRLARRGAARRSRISGSSSSSRARGSIAPV